MSAAEILREAPEIDIDTEHITYSPPRKAKLARNSRAKPQSKAQPAKGGQDAATDNPAEVELSPKRFKSRTKKPVPDSDLETGQKALSKGRVTKATAPDKPKAKKRAETVSRHFTTSEKRPEEGTTSEQPRNTPPPPSQPREPALARRVDWTPPRADSALVILDSESDNRELLSSMEKVVGTRDIFDKLFDDFAHKSKEPETSMLRAASESTSDVLKKRKRLEFVSIGEEKLEEKLDQPREVSPNRPPVIKKKTRTLTELATAPYAASEIPDIDLLAPGDKASLLKYFDTDGQYTSLVEHQAMIMDKHKEKPKKKPAKPRKKKGATVEDPILLSPSSALKQSTAQDFVFGTSSQLVTEDSPRTLRNLQAAIRASEQDDDPFASSPKRKADRQKGLWHAGARDTVGDLLETEVVDLKTVTEIAGDVPETATDTPLDQAEFPDIDKIDLCSPQAAEQTIDPQSRPWPLQNQEAILAATESRPPPPNTTSEDPSLSGRASTSREAAPVSAPRPKYELFTDAQLAKQITSYGFKPVKRRSAMVAILDQCWTSQHRGSSTAHLSLGTTASLSTSAAQSSPKKKPSAATKLVEVVKKPRGRPKKIDQQTSVVTDNTAISPKRGRPKKADQRAVADDKSVSPKQGPGRPRKTSITASDSDAPLASKRRAVTPTKRKKPAGKAVEIADSDHDDCLSLSAESLAESVFSSPPPLDLSMSEEGETSLNSTPTEQEANLFTHITKAVTSTPRSTDPSEPSWHEKMLIYDPVVLEDLAAWLNTGQLTRVGYDGEVSPYEVKKWCESKSVICLWKTNIRGRERKRF